MDQDAKIQSYALLAKGLKGRAVVEVITRASSDPAVFGFGELLDLPSVREVRRAARGWGAECATCAGCRGEARSAQGRLLACVHLRARRACRCVRKHGAQALARAMLPPPSPPRPSLCRIGGQQLQQGEHAPHYALLQLFAYGTWPEYQGAGPTAAWPLGHGCAPSGSFATPPLRAVSSSVHAASAALAPRPGEFAIRA